jgi:peptidoglycan/LPS O-acetylase OafA/YrhL
VAEVQQGQQRSALHSLTSLRYPAALAVLLTHVNPYFLSNRWQQVAFSYGYGGVSFFFLLSGFVLTWSCAEQPAQRFWWNRFARIWPLMALMMATDYLFFWSDVRHPASPVGWPMQLFLVQSWSPSPGTHSGGDGGTWSLSCEMFFYAMFPLIMTVTMRLRRRGVLLAAAGTVAALALAPALALPHLHNSNTSDWLFFYLPGYRIGEFIIGMLLARAVRLGVRVRPPGAGYLVALAGLTGWIWLITQAAVHNHDTGLARPWVALSALPFLALLVLSAASADVSGTARLLSGRLPVLLGEWSFAFYMVQGPVMAVVSGHGWMSAGGRPGGVGDLLLYIVLATGIAALASGVIEKPAERWLRARRPGGAAGTHRVPRLPEQVAAVPGLGE